MIPLLSLFCGCGGLDQGFVRHGFRPLLALDCDPSAVDTYNRNLPSVAVEADLAGISSDAVRELWEERSDVPPRGIVGGPPCQAFSSSNVSDTRWDPRKRLTHNYAKIVNDFSEDGELDFFLFENVPGLLSDRHRRHYDRLRKTVGPKFFVSAFLLDAKDYGVAQTRKRLFVLGINRDLYTREFQPPPPLRTKKYKTVREAIGHLPEPSYFERGADAASFPAHPNHWTMRPRSHRFTEGIKDRSNKTRSFRVLDWDRPSWTVAYGNREVHLHPNGNRRLSVYEAMLLQGFPPKFRLSGSLSAQYRLVSDSVPPPVAGVLARHIRQQSSL